MSTEIFYKNCKNSTEIFFNGDFLQKPKEFFDETNKKRALFCE
jgi:hypothetical protein